MKTVEIVPQVKLTTKQRITLVHMANNGGKTERLEYDVQNDLIYLGLVERYKLHDKETVRKQTAAAWKALALACRARNAKAAEDAVNIVRRERWELEKDAWRLTPAASQYLLKGRVTVTVGKSVQGPVEIQKAG